MLIMLRSLCEGDELCPDPLPRELTDIRNKPKPSNTPPLSLPHSWKKTKPFNTSQFVELSTGRLTDGVAEGVN